MKLRERLRPLFHTLGLLSLALVLAGCPKSPGTAAPGGAMAPFGGGTSSVVPSALEATASRTAPTPKEFMSVADLRDIHFDFDRYEIRPGDARTLDANARWIKANANYLVLIEGHADERGTNEYNLALGERRAKATMSYLVAQGVPAARLSIISYGEERPLCMEKTEECWARNRRAASLVKRF